MTRETLATCALALIGTVVGAQQSPPIDVTTIGPRVGERAIEFRLPDQTGRERTLTSLAGSKGTMLVFFRSSDWWPYCRTQLVELQRHLRDVTDAGFSVAAISYDSVETLKAFAEKHTITFPLLSDAGSKTITAWGILNKEATGRTAGIPHPGTFMIDRNGQILSRSSEQPYQERRSATSLLVQLAGASPGQSTTLKAAQATFELSASDAVAAVGHRVTLRIRVTPGPKMHVYAPGQKGYIPIALTLTPDAAFKAHALRLPASTTYHYKPLNETVQVYSAPFTIAQDVTIALTPDVRARAARGDVLTIAGQIEYQACDDAVCYRPETIPVAWKVTLSPIVR